MTGAGDEEFTEKSRKAKSPDVACICVRGRVYKRTPARPVRGAYICCAPLNCREIFVVPLGDGL